MLIVCILSSMLICGTVAIGIEEFPGWFKFGAATAAYQVEGAWNSSDKGESIWDRLVHTQPLATDYQTGDIACDSYHHWRRDIELCKELGVTMYRFSISWPRLLPTGFPNIISEDGKRYYNDLIDSLLEKGIEPVVTIFHFDLPQSLQDLGGWANPLISDWFADYARVVYSLFADRVKTWLTVNEPSGFCAFGYSKRAAPYIDDTKVGSYLCAKHTVLAHAKAWRIYDEEYKPLYKGRVSMVTIFIWFEPKTPEDEELAKLAQELWSGRLDHPVYSKEGGWPPGLEKFLKDKSKEEGYSFSRLPPFTAEEIEFVRGTYDFYGMNFYLSRVVSRAEPGEISTDDILPFYGSEELGIKLEADPNAVIPAIDWFSMNPPDLRKQLHWLNQTYGEFDVLITENGYPSSYRGLDDWERIKATNDFLEQVLLSIKDGLNVIGYIAWSLMDNFEWMSGYRITFGLYAVDFSAENRTRTPRASAKYFSSITRTRRLQHVLEEPNYV